MIYGIVFATPDEAAPFLEISRAKEIDGVTPPTYRFSLPAGGENGYVTVCGMGPEAAAAATAALVRDRGVDVVVNAGAAAAATGAGSIGELYRVDRVADHSGGGDAERSNRVAGSRWTNLPAASLATVARPVHDPGLRDRIGRSEDLIDMEGAAVAATCARFGVECHLLKGITDRADGTASETIRGNLSAVSGSMARVLWDGLASGPRPEPGAVSNLLSFTRIEHTVFSLPLLFAGAWMGAGHRFPGPMVLLLIALAGVGARVLGMAMNRILDRDLDARNPRTAGRELPSGRMSLGGAAAVAAAGLAAYMAACALLGKWCLILSPVPAAALILYSVLKRFTSLCHFGIGLCLALAPLGAFVAASGGLEFDRAVLLLAVFSFLWISGFDVIYALQDLESDRSTGVHSIPARFGSAGAQAVAALVHGIALAALAAMVLDTSGGIASWGAFAVALGAMALAYAPWIPLPARFFPLSAIAGIAGAVAPLLGGLP